MSAAACDFIVASLLVVAVPASGPAAFGERPHQLPDGRVELRSVRDDAGMADAMAADQRDQVDVGERIGAQEHRGGGLDGLVGKPQHQRGRRILALGECGCDKAA